MGRYSSPDDGFPVIIQPKVIYTLLGPKLYSSQDVFIRENIQNAVDAVRIRALRDGSTAHSQVHVTIKPTLVEVEDWGIGMTRDDLRQYYWAVGETSKKTPEAQQAGCIGLLGIGGFANFGICRELSLYTAVSDAPEDEICTSMTKEDLDANRQVRPTLSHELGHQGTLIRCYPQTSFDVSAITEYLDQYVRHLSESITVNGKLVSQQQFLPADNGIKHAGRRLPYKHGWIAGDILEYPDHRVTFRPSVIKYGRDEFTISGELELSSDSVDVYKNRFLMVTFLYPRKRLGGKIDLPFVIPLANRESLDGTSEEVVKLVLGAIKDTLIEYIGSSAELVSSYRGAPLIDEIYVSEKVSLLRKLSVTLVDTTTCTLEIISQRAEEFKRRAVDARVYYFQDRELLPTAQFLQNRGNIVVPTTDLDKNTRWIVNRYLTSYCNATEVPRIVSEEVDMTHLSPDARYVIGAMEKFLDDQGCSKLKVKPCRFVASGGIPVRFVESREVIEVNIEHENFAALCAQTNSQAFRTWVEYFLKDYLDNTLAKYRRKIFGEKGVGIHLTSDDALWEVVIETISRVRLVKKGGTPWAGADADILIVEGDFLEQLNGYYFRLPDELVRAYERFLTREHTIEVIFFLKRAIYLVYHEVDATLMLEINLDKAVTLPEASKAGSRLFNQSMKRHIIRYPNGTYMPIPRELEANFLPSGRRIIWLGVKVEY